VRRAATALLAGSLLAVGAPASWLLLGEDGPTTYGGSAAEDLRTAPSLALDPTTTSARLADLVPAPAAPAPAAPPQAAPAPAAPAAPSAAPGDATAPVEVRLAGRSVPIDPVGLDEDRLVVIPEDVRRAGWYSPGPLPGAANGSAVLVGHVDDRSQGLGAFAVLPDLAAGDDVVVRTAAGQQLTYDVVSLERFPKAKTPLARLFAADGPHRLVLITCGGDFDASRSSYRDNVVVTAVLRA
jgi:hypothetical protein